MNVGLLDEYITLEFEDLKNNRNFGRDIYNRVTFRDFAIYDPDKVSNAKTKAITEPYWRRFSQSTFNRKHAPSLEKKRNIFDQLFIQFLGALKGEYVIKISLDNRDLPCRNLFWQIIKYLENARAIYLKRSPRWKPASQGGGGKQPKKSRLWVLPNYFDQKEEKQLLAAVEKIEYEKIPPKVDWVQIRNNKLSVSADTSNPFVRRRTEELKTMMMVWRLNPHGYRKVKVNDNKQVVLDENKKPVFEEFKLLPLSQPYAVFTGDLLGGGRTNVARTTIRKLERPTIMFKKGRTKYKSCEWDYSNTHIKIAYSELGINYQGDAYMLLSESEMEERVWGKARRKLFRALSKIMLNAMLNAKTISKAVSSLNNQSFEYKKYKDKESGHYKVKPKDESAAAKARKLKAKIRLLGMTFKELSELVIRKHPLLVPLFDNGESMGIKYQRIESDMAANIVNYLSVRGIPVIPFAESFVCPVIYENELVAAMNRFYEQGIGYPPQIEKKH